MSGQPKKLRMEEGKADTATRSPPKKSRATQTIPKKKKLKSEAEKVKEKAAKLRLGKAEITPEEVSRMTKAQKRELYAAAAARSAAHREVERYEDDNVGAQALNEGEKTAEGAGHYNRSRYARRLKKKAKLQAGKKKTRTEKTAASDESKRTSTAEGEVHWFSRWKQRQEIRKSYYAAAQSGGMAAQAAGSSKAVSGSASAARSGVEQVTDKGRSAVSAAVNGIANFAKGNAHALVVVGVFLLLLLLVMSAFSSCSNLLKRNFRSDVPLKKCITDITEIKAKDGKLYTSVIFDCFDLSVLGIAMSTNMKAELCVQTLDDAMASYPALRGAIIHSDRGAQYTSDLYRRAITRYGICQSMNSAGGRCHDNARCESMWARMKTELLYDRYDPEQLTVEQLKSLVWRYFMSYWNNRRICSANGGLPPMVKRRRFYVAQIVAA